VKKTNELYPRVRPDATGTGMVSQAGGISLIVPAPFPAFFSDMLRSSGRAGGPVRCCLINTPISIAKSDANQAL